MVMTVRPNGPALAQDRTADQARLPPLHQGTGSRDQHLHRCAQRQPHAFPLDEDGRRHPRIDCTRLPQNPRRPSAKCIGTSESGR